MGARCRPVRRSAGGSPGTRPRPAAPTAGTPSKRSPPPGLGITTRRTGDGRYVPASKAWRTCAQCPRSHRTSSSVVMLSTPGAPRLALTRLNARPRFSGESICSHKLTSRPGMTASSECADRPLRSAAVLNRTHRLLPAAGPRPRDGCDQRHRHEQHRLRLTRRPVLPGPIRSRPVLRPLLTSARSARPSRSGPSARRQRQHNRHPGRPPRIRTINFPLRPPRLRDDPVDGDGLCLLEQAHPDRPASYAVRVPRCRDTPWASFLPRLTATQLPPARS